MSAADIVNAVFEGGGGLIVWLSILSLWKNKSWSGVSIWPTIFFNSWGFWNLFYYWHLHQWFSWTGGLLLVISNTILSALMVKYRDRTNL